MTAAATILAVLLIAAVIYILVQAELHHEDAGTIRDLKAQAALDAAQLMWRDVIIRNQRERIANLSHKAAAWDQLDAGTKRLIEALDDPDWSAS